MLIKMNASIFMDKKAICEKINYDHISFFVLKSITRSTHKCQIVKYYHENLPL